ncbi:MAG: Golgi apyrase [Cirrosporium novae-zelandiae]|nr:MAG: Golgi apyrase [Cirrosporium novae-zelandiae]
MGKWRYGVILDAGSSGTRVYIYRWLDSTIAREKADRQAFESLPALHTKKHWTLKLKPGISTFGDNPNIVGPEYLQPLLQHALDIVPEEDVAETPFFLLATAGMRLLPEIQRKELLSQICTYARLKTNFSLPDCNLHVQVIPGETEGLYGWIAANYLLGGFDNPDDHSHGKGHHTYGFLDMGGASAQIAFAPNVTEAQKHADDLKLLRMRNINGLSTEYRVFVTTWLGFGVNEARKRYIQSLLEASATHDAHELPDPCLPVGLTITTKGDILLPDSPRIEEENPYLIGTGRFDECLRQTYPLLDKDAPCEDEPCLLHGVHVPAIDFDVNHFVGVSEYWHTTHEVFEMSHKDDSYDFNTYQQRVKDFCSQDWATIEKGVDNHEWGKRVDEHTALEVCFKASWLINVLHDGIGIPRVGLEDAHASSNNGTKAVLAHAKEKGFLDPFQAVDKIDDTEVSWTLGKMVLYAASQVRSKDSLPVGFGSNVPGIPEDFQYAGGRYRPLPNTSYTDDLYSDDDGEDWHTALFDTDSPRRIPGFLIFMLIVCIAVFLLCGKGRRIRIYRKLGINPPSSSKRRRFFTGKLFSNGSSATSYEHLEAGPDPSEFELGDVESDHSNSSEETRAGRTSGLATPHFNLEKPVGGSYFDYPPPTPMDRSGLVVRTESRERLLSPGLGPSGGKRSRAGSPTRHKSPLMTPLEED